MVAEAKGLTFQYRKPSKRRELSDTARENMSKARLAYYERIKKEPDYEENKAKKKIEAKERAKQRDRDRYPRRQAEKKAKREALKLAAD